MAGVGNLDIADGTRDYIVQKLNPLLVELVQVLVRQTPVDTKKFIMNWLYCLKNKGQKELVVEHARLEAELDKLKRKNAHYSTLAVTILGDDAGKAAADDDDEEEDDDDDELDEIPESMMVSADSRGKMRQSVSAEAYGQWNQKKEFTPPVHAKTEAQRARLISCLKDSFLFSNLAGKDFDVAVNAMEEVNAAPGETVIKQGDEGDFLFVIEEGTLNCTKPIDGEIKTVKTVTAGDVFGELALLYTTARAATVSVDGTGPAKMWKLDRDTFNNIVKGAASQKRERFMTTLQKVPILANLGEYELSQIADALKTEEVESDTVIIKQGDSGDTFYILEEGSAKAVRDGATVMQYKDGDFFGELALLHDAPRAASIISTSKTGLLVLERKAFNRLLGTLSELRTQKYA
jgi:cAMP-dependent protein kinase regulator